MIDLKVKPQKPHQLSDDYRLQKYSFMLENKRTLSKGYQKHLNYRKKFSEPSENPKTIYLRHFYEVLAKFKDSSRFKPVYASLRWFMPFHRVPVTIDTSLLSQNEFFIA